jgi:hypothetical protein
MKQMKNGMIISFLLLFSACNNHSQQEVPAGGPCTYKNTVRPARLIHLISNDSVNYDAVLEISRSAVLLDTVYYQRIHHRLLSAEEVKKDSLLVGTTYQYVEQDLVMGSCTPHIVSILFKKM